MVQYVLDINGTCGLHVQYILLLLYCLYVYVDSDTER